MEILASAVILCATVTVVTKLLFQCGVVWRDVSHHRVAEAKLTGTIVEDNLGVRIELSINWKRAVESKPMVMCGWLIESEGSK